MKLSDEFKGNTDPWKWLTSEQIADAVKPNEALFRKKFTPEEQEFRERYWPSTCSEQAEWYFRMTKYVESVEWTPLSMSDEILKQLPDCQFYTAQYDVLKNDADILHARLQSLRKPTKMTVWEGQLSIVLCRIKQTSFHLFVTTVQVRFMVKLCSRNPSWV